MSPWSGKRTIAVVSACMQKDGTPTFAMNEVAVTYEDAENGIQYYLVEADLLEAGFEEPFVHFADDEAPPFLFPAVQESLAVATAVQNLTLSEAP